MATYQGYLLISLPDNTNADNVLVYSSATSSGVFTLANTLDYVYPNKTVEYTVDDTLFYKVAFSESATSWVSALSSVIAGSKVLETAPSIAITSSYDGVSYSTPDDVYAVSNLTTEDVSNDDVIYAIATARAFIDLKTSSLSINRFNAFSNGVAKKKYNATLKILKDVEINFAISLIYRDMANKKIIEKVRNNTSSSTSISIGQTYINESQPADSVDIANYLDSLSSRYSTYALGLLDTVIPNYVPLRYSEHDTGYVNSWHSYIINRGV